MRFYGSYCTTAYILEVGVESEMEFSLEEVTLSWMLQKQKIKMNFRNFSEVSALISLIAVAKLISSIGYTHYQHSTTSQTSSIKVQRIQDRTKQGRIT